MPGAPPTRTSRKSVSSEGPIVIFQPVPHSVPCLGTSRHKQYRRMMMGTPLLATPRHFHESGFVLQKRADTSQSVCEIDSGSGSAIFLMSVSYRASVSAAFLFGLVPESPAEEASAPRVTVSITLTYTGGSVISHDLSTPSFLVLQPLCRPVSAE